jgi:hypothetical protein
VCKTPFENVRLTTCFAGEHEVRSIDPGRVEAVETHREAVTRRFTLNVANGRLLLEFLPEKGSAVVSNIALTPLAEGGL